MLNLNKIFSVSRCGIVSQKKGDVEEHIFGSYLHNHQDLKGWE